MPRPVPVEFDPTFYKVFLVDYLRHKIVRVEEIPNQRMWRRFVAQCGMTIDEHVEQLTGDRWDQKNQRHTCEDCGT